MTSQALISKIHCTLSANQKRDSELNYFSVISVKKKAKKFLSKLGPF